MPQETPKGTTEYQESPNAVEVAYRALRRAWDDPTLLALRLAQLAAAQQS